MPKSAFQPTRKLPSQQENQGFFFSSPTHQPEQQFFQSSSADTVQAQLETDTVGSNMGEEEEVQASMEKTEEEEVTAGMEAPQEEMEEAPPA